jgi:hypothetical protein
MRLLLAIAAALVAAIVTFIGAFAICAGAAWIFIFGDDPWPEWSNAALLILPAIAAVVATWRTFRNFAN